LDAGRSICSRLGSGQLLCSSYYITVSIMRGSATDFGLFGFCFAVKQKILKFSNLCYKPAGVLSRRDGHIRRRLLTIESLETRALMSGDGLTPSVDPIWFQDFNAGGSLLHAGYSQISTESGKTQPSDSVVGIGGQADAYDWIVQFNTQAVGAISSVEQVSSLLVGGGVDFQILRGLGLVGQVLVRSSGVSCDTVTSWLANNVNIASYEQDSLRQLETVPNDPGMGQLYGMNKINASGAWNLSTGSTSVVVGVVDTGIDYSHPDLAANIWRNSGEIAGNGIDDDHNGFTDDVYGYDFVNNDGNPMDDNSHGTHVSGTIAGVGNNSQGVAGVNWNASLMALKFLDANGSGYVSDAVRAINYATMMRSQYGVNVRVLNNSWGGGGFSSSLDAAIQASNNAGILFVAAAGNDAANNDASPHYPANYTSTNVISVAATDQNDRLASFSCYGATTVDLAAPGVSIYSTVINNRYATYSGTSMATPHVTGVAALAWAYKPTATVAEIRNALLQGVDHLSALSGKVVTGGRLNAYNTLQLLGGSTPAGPVLGSFGATPYTVTPGTSVTLAAQVASSTNAVSAVYFYRDTNGNGALDAGDATVGTDTTVVNSAAEVLVNTSGMTLGTYGYFARALDNANQWSSPLMTTLTVIAPDDHGNSFAAATAISVNTVTAGTIGTSGDEDWFKFQAAAGKQYIITTTLTGLPDSVLTLYDRNGSTILASNDDVSRGNYASRIEWTAPASGTYFIKTTAYAADETGAYTLSLTAVNAAPVLQAISNQTMSYRTDTLTVPLSASDADGDALSYSATAYTIDPIAQRAYELQQQYGFFQWEGSYWTNIRGRGEKYIADSAYVAYFILPNGNFYRWGGSIDTSALICTFSTAYYNDPRLIHQAQAPAHIPVASSVVSLSLSGNQLTINPAAGYEGEFYIDASVNDGTSLTTKSFKVSVTNSAPVVQAIADQTMSHRTDSLAVPFSAGDADGDTLSYSVTAYTLDPMAQQAYELEQQYGFFQWEGSYWTNIRGRGEKYIADSALVAYFILPNGNFYRWGGSIDTSTLICTFSAAYYNDPRLIHEAQAPTIVPLAANQATVSVVNNTIVVNPAADYTGHFNVNLNAGDGVQMTTESFRISVTNSAPALQSISNQVMPSGTNSITIPLSASDTDGDPLTISATAGTTDPMAQKAYDLNQQYHFFKWQGSYWTNIRGRGEKYIADSDYVAYFILPNGNFYRWGGSINTSTLIYTFSTAYYNDPRLIHEARAPVPTLITNGSVTVNVAGNQLTVNRAAGYTGTFNVSVTASDGTNSVAKSFNVTATNSAPLSLASSLFYSQSGADILARQASLTQASATALLPASFATWYANRQDSVSATQPYNVVSFRMRVDESLNSPSAIHAKAVELAFHEGDVQDTAYLSDRLGYFKNGSWSAVGQNNPVLGAGNNNPTRNNFLTYSKSEGLRHNTSSEELSREIEASIANWDNQSSGTRAFDEFFALLGSMKDVY
jgi:subtilisin family serine protease